MKYLLLLLLLPITSLAQNAKEFKIKGEFKSMKPIEKVYLHYYDGENRQVDSMDYADEFKFEGNISEPTLATMVVKYAEKDDNGRNVRESAGIYLEPSKIEVVVMGSMETISVSGSESHVIYDNLNQRLEPYQAKLNDLYKLYSQHGQSNDQAAQDKIVKEIRSLQSQMGEDVYKTYALAHPNSPVALYAIRQYAGYDIDAPKVAPLYNALSAEIKSLPSAKDFGEQLELAKKTAIGQPAMDFTQNDPTGNPVSLASFKGKYVLVDFWASWCGPCRKENPNVVKAYNAFKDKNFTVLGISLDRTDGKEKWIQAIEKDNLTWTQVSDLQYFDNAVAKQYGIRAIPQNLLIDPNGIIVAKNLRGEDLVKKLEEIIK